MRIALIGQIVATCPVPLVNSIDAVAIQQAKAPMMRARKRRKATFRESDGSLSKYLLFCIPWVIGVPPRRARMAAWLRTRRNRSDVGKT